MNKNDAVKQIIEKYMQLHDLSPAEFARKCEVSKSFMSKILNSVSGKFGISFAYLQKLAIGMNMDTSQLQHLIDNFQESTINNMTYSKKNTMITEINKCLNSLNEKDIETLHRIILELATNFKKNT